MIAVMGSVPPVAWLVFGIVVAELVVAVGVDEWRQARREHRSGEKG